MRIPLDGLESVRIEDELGVVMTPAKESTLQSILTSLGTLSGGMGGTATDGQVTLTNANEFYEVPAIADTPTAVYVLIVEKETIASGATVRFSFKDTAGPSSVNGVKWIGNYPMVFIFAANKSLYVRSTNAGDTINWTAIKIS